MRLFKGVVVGFLHPAHALRGTARFSLTLTGMLLKLHLTETESQTHRNATTVVLVVGC